MADENKDAVASTPAAPTKARVKYVGGSDIRRIDKVDWERDGVKDQDSVFWSASNDFTVDNLTPAAIKQLAKDAEFKVL